MIKQEHQRDDIINQMKAVQINQYGGIDVLKINGEVPQSVASENQILVEVYAAGINPIDYKIRSGYLKDVMPIQFPATLGGDFSGKVIELGKGVSEFKAGDEVYGSAIILNGGSGAFAQYLTANSKDAAIKPNNIDFLQAASLPLAGSSAIQALEEHIKLQPEQKILIQGGAGGIGSLAIQIAKSLGAYVATTVGWDDYGFVKNLGADEVIDYKKQSFEQILKDFDAVFDTVGGEVADRSFKVLKEGGIIVSMLGQPNQQLAQQLNVTATGQNTNINTDHLNRLRELVDNGKLKTQIDKVFDLDQIKEAFTYQEEIHPKGKVVIRIKN